MIGTKVGHLTIQRKLGEGGMGAVYLAEHQVMKTKRAVKVLLPEWTKNATIVQRFMNEAIAAGSIRHRNIISVHDCGQLPDGSWYMVMDYLEGGTLRGFCQSQGGPLSTHLTLQILAAVANGLEVAHDAKLVHRDLKPDNIFLIQHEGNAHHPVVLDWGIGKLGEHEGGAVTRTGTMAGTPAYMAPEQMRDLRLADRRSDVYALGVIAYQMITGGWFPYQSQDTPGEYSDMTAAAIYHLQMSVPSVDPRQRFSGVSDGWANAIQAALHPDPARRPQTARAFVLMLAEATPGDTHLLSGTDIIRTYAKELLEIGNLLETVRAPKPVVKETQAGAVSRYRLGDRIGMGGMAEVFRATMTGAEGFSRTVAVKRVLAGFSTVPQFASMFVQEAQIASQLTHPNVVPVLDFDRDPEGRLFLAMEFVDGRDLASLVETGPLPFSTVIFIISEVLRGLGYAHELPTGDGPLGVIHRDVSPHNVLLSWEGAVKVSDFGIAKAREASAATASTLVKGKASYMSPEQANGEGLDGRSDLFAVGVMFWELLTGTRLFAGSTREAIAQVFFRPIPLPTTVRGDIPPDLVSVVMRLLERDRSARYANAELAIEDLARCAVAPRNGRSELARLLAERFPQAVAARASRPQLESSAPPLSGGLKGNVTVPNPSQPIAPPLVATPHAAWQPSETTLGNAASQAVSSRPRAPRRWPWIAAGTIGAAMSAIVVLVVMGSFDSDTAITRANRIPSTASADARTEPAVSTLTIKTEPPGALVRLDDGESGASPMTVRVALGRRLVIDVERDGFERGKQIVTVGPEPQTVTIALKPMITRSAIDASVPDASEVSKGPVRPSTPTRPKKQPRDPGERGSGGFRPNDVGGD